MDKITLENSEMKVKVVERDDKHYKVEVVHVTGEKWSVFALNYDNASDTAHAIFYKRAKQ